MSKIKDIIHYLEGIAPKSYQESYDNSGLLTGNANEDLKGVLISLDITEEVVEDAINQNCNLIVAHHPIIFKGLKKLTGSNYVERTVLKAIKNDIALYAIHTNLDNVHVGVNKKICDKIGIQNPQILAPKSGQLMKITTFIPAENTDEVMEAVYQSGAGEIGDYSKCSFRVNGTGTFLPNENANPHLGQSGQLEKVNEDRVEVIFPAYMKSKVIKSLTKAHPYEEVAYYLYDLNNDNPEIGSGMIGILESEMSEEDFIGHLKKSMDLKVVRHTRLLQGKIKKVAVCGGAGSFLLSRAISHGADVFISSDFKYHEFFDAEDNIVIMDIGHYESEVFTKDLIFELLNKNFPNIALRFTKVNTNPIRYA